jgi:hypothetical protein
VQRRSQCSLYSGPLPAGAAPRPCLPEAAEGRGAAAGGSAASSSSARAGSGRSFRAESADRRAGVRPGSFAPGPRSAGRGGGGPMTPPPPCAPAAAAAASAAIGTARSGSDSACMRAAGGQGSYLSPRHNDRPTDYMRSWPHGNNVASHRACLRPPATACPPGSPSSCSMLP